MITWTLEDHFWSQICPGSISGPFELAVRTLSQLGPEWTLRVSELSLGSFDFSLLGLDHFFAVSVSSIPVLVHLRVEVRGPDLDPQSDLEAESLSWRGS